MELVTAVAEVDDCGKRQEAGFGFELGVGFQEV